MDWVDYVRQTIGRDARQREVAEQTGLDQATVSRWMRGDRRQLTPYSVTKFANGYGRPVLEAFVAAGLISEADARVRTIRPKTLDSFDVDDLLAEVARRTRDVRIESTS